MLCVQKRCYVTGGLHAAHFAGWVPFSYEKLLTNILFRLRSPTGKDCLCA